MFNIFYLGITDLQEYTAYGFLGFIGLIFIITMFLFIKSIINQVRYNHASLPNLVSDEEEELSDEEESSNFFIEEDDFSLPEIDQSSSLSQEDDIPSDEVIEYNFDENPFLNNPFNNQQKNGEF